MFESSKKKNVTLLNICEAPSNNVYYHRLLSTTLSYFRTHLKGLSKMFERPGIDFEQKLAGGDDSLKKVVFSGNLFVFIVHFLYSKLMKSPPFPKREFLSV